MDSLQKRLQLHQVRILFIEIHYMLENKQNGVISLIFVVAEKIFFAT